MGGSPVRTRVRLLGWGGLTAVAVAVALLVSGDIANRGYVTPGGEDDRVVNLLAEHVQGYAGTTLAGLITVRYPLPPPTRAGFEAAARRRGLAAGDRRMRIVADLEAVPGVMSVESVIGRTYEVRGSPDRAQSELLTIQIDSSRQEAEDRLPELEAALARSAEGRDSVALTGGAAISRRFAEISGDDLQRAELIALPLLLVVLLLAFLSIGAAVLPLVLAGVTLACTLAVLHLVSLGYGLSVFAGNTASAVALGLSIDYSLLIVTRYREELAGAEGPREALARTMKTAGRAVLLSGLTIAACLVALLIVGVGIFTSMALSGIVASLIAVAAALTLLPALILLLGVRLERFALTPVTQAARRGTAWDRLGYLVTARPALLAAGAIAILLAAAVPLRSVELSFGDGGFLTGEDPVNRPLEQASRLFGPGAIGPFFVVTKDPTAASAVLRSDPSVALIWGRAEGGDGWVAIRGAFKTAPGEDATARAVERLRRKLSRLQPPSLMTSATGFELDLTNRVEERTPWVILFAALAALVSLAIGLRSIVVPLKAILCSLLSVAATLGLLSVLFPAGGTEHGIPFFVPLFIFVLVFGLSIDYEVFLVSRIREAVESGSSTSDAVRHGLARSGRVITLAGLAVAVVFAAFAPSALEPIRQIGLGVAIAVIIDATLVRCILIPASIVLLGRWNWWLPPPARNRHHRAQC